MSSCNENILRLEFRSSMMEKLRKELENLQTLKQFDMVEFEVL